MVDSEDTIALSCKVLRLLVMECEILMCESLVRQIEDHANWDDVQNVSARNFS